MRRIRMPTTLLLLYAFFSIEVLGRSLADIQKTGVAKLAAEGSLVPFNYYEKSVLKGFEIELADHLFRRLGVKTEWQTQSFQSLLVGLGRDRYDAVVASLAMTPERAKVVEFVNPHYCSGPVLLSAAKGPLTPTELKGKKAAAKEGTIYFKFLASIAGVGDVRSLPNNADLIQALLSKRVDAILINEFAAANMIKAHSNSKLAMGSPLMKEELAIAVSKGNVSLQQALNEQLSVALKDGTYETLSKKYFNRDIRCK